MLFFTGVIFCYIFESILDPTIGFSPSVFFFKTDKIKNTFIVVYKKDKDKKTYF